MNLQAFVDESADTKFFVLAGCVSSPQKWSEFSSEWEKRLPFATLQPNNKYRFKMSEMAMNGRIEDVAYFYRAIEEFAELAISVVFDISHLENALRRITVPGLRINWAGWKNPYLVGFRTLTDVINRRRNELSPALSLYDKIDFYFDERVEKLRVIWAWDRIAAKLPPEDAILYSKTPRFENDEEYLPLQAADFWAWWVRRWARNGSSPDPSDGFPWSFDAKKPARLMITFDEEEFIEYLVNESQSMLPKGKSFTIAPPSFAGP
jgi:hypothetical protein